MKLRVVKDLWHDVYQVQEYNTDTDQWVGFERGFFSTQEEAIAVAKAYEAGQDQPVVWDNSPDKTAPVVTEVKA